MKQIILYCINTNFSAFSAMLAEAARNKKHEFRTYRVEKHYAVSAGKW
jgi:hypothetical protein